MKVKNPNNTANTEAPAADPAQDSSAPADKEVAAAGTASSDEAATEPAVAPNETSESEPAASASAEPAPAAPTAETKPAKSAESKIDKLPLNAILTEEPVEIEDESPAPALNVPTNDELIAKFLVNPSKVIEEISDAAVAKVRKLDQDEKNAKTAWRNFYTENKDLEPFPEVVSMVSNQLYAKWKKSGSVPKWGEGSKELAKEARRLVSKIRGSDSDIEAVDTESKAAVVSSSGNPAPVTVTKPAERRNFVEQMRSFQESKGKVAY